MVHTNTSNFDQQIRPAKIGEKTSIFPTKVQLGNLI